MSDEEVRIAQLERVVRGYDRLMAAQVATFVLALVGMIAAGVLAHYTTEPGEPASWRCWALLLGAYFGYWVGEHFWIRPWRARPENEGDAALREGASAPEAEG